MYLLYFILLLLSTLPTFFSFSVFPLHAFCYLMNQFYAVIHMYVCAKDVENLMRNKKMRKENSTKKGKKIQSELN